MKAARPIAFLLIAQLAVSCAPAPPPLRAEVEARFVALVGAYARCDAAFDYAGPEAIAALTRLDFDSAAAPARAASSICRASGAKVAGLGAPPSSRGKLRVRYERLLASCASIFDRKAQFWDSVSLQVTQRPGADPQDPTEKIAAINRDDQACLNQYAGLAGASGLTVADLKARATLMIH